MAQRLALLEAWLTTVLGSGDRIMEPASGDASFRNYWRVHKGDCTYIAMDAPPGREHTDSFVRIAKAFRAIGLNTPEIYAREPSQGFLLIGDLGSRLYLDVLDAGNVDRLYADALGALAIIQACGPLDGLPVYDGPFIYREMELFRDWLLDRQLGLALSAQEQATIDQAFDALAASALEQPRVCVHRDFHSRNLMITDPPSPGILDFQDAVAGPVTYDLVSLLRDCYVAWPRERVEEWARGYFGLALQTGILRDTQEARFLSWFDLMGAQRHLKASGIFARLNCRDAKPGYLQDIPRTLGYVVEIAPSYPALRGLGDLISSRVLPALN